jgi:dTDP-glucose 4,6-dehydratase
LRVLITGGAGFVGSNFAHLLIRLHPDYKILNLDKLTYAGNLQNLSDLETNPNYSFHKGDICDSRCVEELLRGGVDAVIHFAAESHVDRSIADARAFIETNVQGTYTLLDVARRLKIPRFVHVSTDEVYGSMAPEESASEETTLAPNSPYAASKAASDLLVRSFWKTYRFPAIITRASNNYGPYQFPEKLIPLMITNALEGKTLPVYGDGMNERDWIFVEDHCRAIDCVLHEGRAGEVYNIGFGKPAPNLEIVRRLLRILGKSEELIEFVVDRPGHDRRYALDTKKITSELGWKPEVDLATGLLRTVEWYRNHSDWVKKAKSGEYRDYYQRFYVNRGTFLSQI